MVKLEKIINVCLAHKFWVLAATALFLGFTLFRLNTLTMDAVPDITNVQVVINTKTLGLDPERVELSVTQPIEYEMMGLERLQDMRSISKLGLSQVTLVFSERTDIYWARQQISERLENIRGNLPADTQPELAPITTGLGEVFMYSLGFDPDSPYRQKSYKEQMFFLRETQDYLVRPQLRRIRDVADIDTSGGLKREIHINIDPVKLIQHGMNIQKVRDNVAGLGESFGGGSIEVEKEALIIKSSTRLDSLVELKNLSLAQRFNGASVRISDVADVSFDASPRPGAATFNGEETVLGTVLMKNGGNGRIVSEEAEARLKSLALPTGVRATVLYSRAYLVNMTLRTVAKNLLEGALLVILVLLILLGHVRAALLVSLVIPLAMLGATLGMQWFHISGNLMSLGAIDFGLVVDGAVVLVEALVARFYLLSREEKNKFSKDYWIVAQARSMITPLLFGLMLIMLVYVPILLLEGIEGKMFRPLAETVLLTLAWAVVFTVGLIPVLVSLFITLPEGDGGVFHETRFFRAVKRYYTPALEFAMAHSQALVGGVLGFLFLGLVLFIRAGSDFIPVLDEGDLVVNITRNARISLSEAVRQQQAVEKKIAALPEVEMVFSRLGTPESATDPMGVHLTDMFVILRKDHRAGRGRSKSEVFKEIKSEILARAPHDEVEATQPIQMRFNEMLEGSRADVSLRVLGPDLKYLVETIDSLAKKVAGVPGLESAEMDPLTALRQSQVVEIKPKFSELARLNIGLEEFNQTIVSFLQGTRVGVWTEGVRKFSIVLHLDEARRNQLSEISALPIALPDGGSVRLEKIAEIKIADQVTTIARNWGERYAALSLNKGDRDTSGFVRDIQKIISDHPISSGHRMVLSGQFNNLERAKTRLYFIIPLTLALVLFLLWRYFGLFSEALIIFLGVPFAAVGGMIGLFLRDIHLSLSAAVGFIALIGVALLNGIVLMSVFHQRRRESPELGLRAIVVEGARSRLRPVLMTAMVASIGFLPMAFNTGIGAEVQRPLATVVIGGILFSTLLTLFLVPNLYLWVHERCSGEAKKNE